VRLPALRVLGHPCPIFHGIAVHSRGYNVHGATCNVRISNSYENRCRYVEQISAIPSLGRFLRALAARPIPHKLSAHPWPVFGIRGVPLVFGILLRLLREMVRTMVRTELLSPAPFVHANPEPLAEFFDTLAWQLFVFLLMIVFAHRLKTPSASNFPAPQLRHIRSG
jgi:hypothetical protein